MYRLCLSTRLSVSSRVLDSGRLGVMHTSIAFPFRDCVALVVVAKTDRRESAQPIHQQQVWQRIFLLYSRMFIWLDSSNSSHHSSGQMLAAKFRWCYSIGWTGMLVASSITPQGPAASCLLPGDVVCSMPLWCVTFQFIFLCMLPFTTDNLFMWQYYSRVCILTVVLVWYIWKSLLLW